MVGSMGSTVQFYDWGGKRSPAASPQRRKGARVRSRGRVKPCIDMIMNYGQVLVVHDSITPLDDHEAPFTVRYLVLAAFSHLVTAFSHVCLLQVSNFLPHAHQI